MVFSAAVSQQALRIIDASLNCIGEGWRLLEKVAREGVEKLTRCKDERTE